jgi:hypothetical protein
MDLLAQLTAEHGKNPYDFFWVLQHDGDNPHLDFVKQHEIWRATLADEEWFSPFAARATLTLISDNGDLVYDLAGETLVCNPRSGDHEIFPLPITEFLHQLHSLESKVLPHDL